MCIHYRKLESQTVNDSHPLPTADDLFDSLVGNRYCTSLDLKSGYYQTDLQEASKHYTFLVGTFGQDD